jgi:hypothetical protein
MKKQVIINAVSPVKGIGTGVRKKANSLVPSVKVQPKKIEAKRTSQTTSLKDPEDNSNKPNRHSMFGSHRKRKTMIENFKEKDDNFTMDDTWSVLREISDLFRQVKLEKQSHCIISMVAFVTYSKFSPF